MLKILHGLKIKKYKILFVDLLLKLIVLILEIQEFLNFTQNLIKKCYLYIFDPIIDKNKVLREHKLKLVSQLKKFI